MSTRKVRAAPGKVRAEQKEATRGRLLRVAQRVFTLHGYDATSIGRVCREARVTHGALYHHFASKLDLFRAVVEQLTADVAAQVRQAAGLAEGWPQIEAACAAYLDACTAASVQALLVRDGPRVLANFEAIDHATNEPLVTGLLRAWIDAGLLRPMPVETVANVLGGAFAAASSAMAQTDDPGRVRSELAGLFGAWLTALRAPGPSPGLPLPAPARTKDGLGGVAELCRRLDAYSPTWIGTFPLGLQIEGSDLDIACSAEALGGFERALQAELRALGVAAPCERLALAPEASVTRCTVDGLHIEVFCQAIPVPAQHGFRHMIVEGRLLAIGGEPLRRAVLARKRSGMKTEAAFAAVLALEGDPFAAVLTLETWSHEQLELRLAASLPFQK